MDCIDPASLHGLSIGNAFAKNPGPGGGSMTYRAALVLKVVFLLVCCAHLASSQSLTVNKYEFAGDPATIASVNACLTASQGANAGSCAPSITTSSIGSPVLYLVAITNSGGTFTGSVSDVVPPGFQLNSVGCLHFGTGSGCPGTITPPSLGPFTVPTSGWIIFLMTGYFKTPGTQANIVNCSATATAPCASANLNIPGQKLSADLAVTKTVTPGTIKLKSNDGGTIANATAAYSITFTNNGPGDEFLNGIVELQDVLTNGSPFPVTYSLTPFQCTPATICPDVLPPAAAGPLSPNATLPLTASYSNLPGHLLAGQSFTITFNAVFDSAASCFSGPGSMGNRGSINYSTSHQTIADADSSNNSSFVPLVLDTTGLTQCVQGGAGVTVSKIQKSPNNPVGWNTGVTYEITVANPTGSAISAVPVTDWVYKNTATPSFTPAVTSAITCVVCSFSSGPAITPAHTISQSFVPVQLFTATIASIPANSSVTIAYTVRYDAPCETDSGQDQITNLVEAGAASSQVTTDLSELRQCRLKVCKMNGLDANANPSVADCVQAASQAPPKIVFGGPPVAFTIFYQNLSSASLAVGTVRDALSLSSSVYGSFPITYTSNCSVLPGGTVTPLPAFHTAPTTVPIQNNNPLWAGIEPIDGASTFGPNSTLMCTVTVTAPAPPDPGITCQGAGIPQLMNSAFMDLSQGAFNDPVRPSIFDQKPADLPLCRKVLVNKTATTTQGGPGRPVLYTITITNYGQNAVGGFVLNDPILPGFTLLSSVPTCSTVPPDPTFCTSVGFTGTTSTNMNAVFPPIAPNEQITITFSVTAPSTGGTYLNVATGSFLPDGGNWYFGGDPALNLVGNAEVQVLTPVLTKSFNPSSVSSGSNSTLTFTITNAAGDPAQSGINFVDTLPPGLAFAATAAVVNCNSPLKPNITATVSGNFLTVSGGLGPRVHVCTVTIPVTVSGCGSLTNDSTNISQTANIDPSGATATLHVQGECGPSLTIDKTVTGVPSGYTGTFVFNVLCATPHGPLQQQVSITLPDTSVVVPGVTAGSSCAVEEGPPPALPSGFAWDSLPQYSPANGLIQIGAGANHVTVTNTAHPCNDNGQITITKRLVGVPPNFTGTFNFNIACTSPTGLVTQQAQITFPGTGTVTVTGLPAGGICTVSETSLAPLPAPLQWQPPVMTPPFGEVSLVGNCCAAVEVVNTAKYCCGNPKKPGGPVDSNPGLPGTNRSAPRKKP